MAATQDDETGPPKPTPSGRSEARLARKAEALKANLKRRKAQSRARADLRDDGSTAAD